MTRCLLSELIPILHLHHGFHTLMRATTPSPIYYVHSRKTLLGYERAIRRVDLETVRSTQQKLKAVWE